MSKRDNKLLLDDMLQSAKKIKKYTSDIDFETFLNDDKTIDAVVRNFDIIGEAANRIDLNFRENNPEMAWNRIRGFRNRIVHEYFGVDQEIIWEIIENYLSELIDWLETKLDE